MYIYAYYMCQIYVVYIHNIYTCIYIYIYTPYNFKSFSIVCGYSTVTREKGLCFNDFYAPPLPTTLPSVCCAINIQGMNFKMLAKALQSSGN